jgi:hypothetical protein
MRSSVYSVKSDDESKREASQEDNEQKDKVHMIQGSKMEGGKRFNHDSKITLDSSNMKVLNQELQFKIGSSIITSGNTSPTVSQQMLQHSQELA